MAYHMYRLFNRNKEMKELSAFVPYVKRKTFKPLFTRLKKKIRKAPRVKIKGSGVSNKKKYGKRYQKRETPRTDDPLMVFYTTAYKQNPASKMAVKWLVEHGVYEGIQRDTLEAVYGGTV